MPIYEYRCEKGHTFERLCSVPAMKLPYPLTPCPECGSSTQRIISVPAAPILKGKGFHSNDYPK